MILITELIENINRSAEESDFVTTRKLIEGNIELLSQHKSSLKRNARELFDFIKDNENSGYETLTRQELGEINVINTYANRFDLKGLKLFIKGKGTLLLKNEALRYLNSDAKILLESMGAINKSK